MQQSFGHVELSRTVTIAGHSLCATLVAECVGHSLKQLAMWLLQCMDLFPSDSKAGWVHRQHTEGLQTSPSQPLAVHAGSKGLNRCIAAA